MRPIEFQPRTPLADHALAGAMVLTGCALLAAQFTPAAGDAAPPARVYSVSAPESAPTPPPPERTEGEGFGWYRDPETGVTWAAYFDSPGEGQSPPAP